MRTWNLTRAREGTSVELTEVPFWAWAAQEIGDTICWAMEKVTGFCFIAPPEWMFQLKWGEHNEDDPDDPLLLSVGDCSWTLGQQLLGGFGAYRREKAVDRFPVSQEWVREHLGTEG